MTCTRCGAAFNLPPSRVKRGAGKFCGKTCYAAHQRENPHTSRGKVARPAITVQCEHCGEDFKTSGSRPRRFCSTLCASAGRQVTKTCATCGKEFTVPRSNADRYTNCSADCRYPDVRYAPCQACGKTFRVSRDGHTHCSEECRRPAVIVACLTCGKERRIIPAQRTRFCSVRCYRMHTGETEPETRVREALESLGLEFIQEAAIPGWPGPVDFLIPSTRLVIEVDGAYWHAKSADRDARKGAYLRTRGYTVVRLGDDPFYGPLSDHMVSMVGAAVSGVEQLA